MDVVAIGINFKTAPLELREQLSYSACKARNALHRLQDEFADTEVMLLSTCNRTELYAASDRELNVNSIARAFVSNGSGPRPELERHLYIKRRKEATEHLMRVATSLDSLVVGETQILGQVKQAYQIALEEKTTGKLLNSLVQQVFRVAKRVRSETEISRGRVSVGSIAVDLAGKIFDDLSSKEVMIIGAGKIGEQTIKSLVERGVRESYVVNRSPDRRQEIADRYGSIPLPFDRLTDFLPRADIVISSTSAPHFVLHTEEVRQAMRIRRERPMLLIDLAVPRDIEDGVGNLDDVYLYNVDDLDGMASENLSKRHDAVEAARAIISEEAERVTSDVRAGTVGLGDFMRKFDANIEEIKDAELSRAFAKESVAPLGETCDRCRDEICNMLHRALSKMAAGPRQALNRAAREGRWEELAEFASKLYGLDDNEDSPETRNSDDK